MRSYKVSAGIGGGGSGVFLGFNIDFSNVALNHQILVNSTMNLLALSQFAVVAQSIENCLAFCIWTAHEIAGRFDRRLPGRKRNVDKIRLHWRLPFPFSIVAVPVRASPRRLHTASD